MSPLGQVDPDLWGGAVRPIALDTNSEVGFKRGG
jgi:hypothetical protein